MTDRRRRRRCPECDSQEVVRIVYGLPCESAVKQAERGEIHLGGCLVSGQDPQWHCQACGHDWPFSSRWVDEAPPEKEG